MFLSPNRRNATVFKKFSSDLPVQKHWQKGCSLAADSDCPADNNSRISFQHVAVKRN